MIYTAPRPPGLRNLGLPWTAEEIARLEQLLKSGVSPGEVARMMERSIVAIRAKAASKGLRLKRPAGAQPPGEPRER